MAKKAAEPQPLPSPDVEPGKTHDLPDEMPAARAPGTSIALNRLPPQHELITGLCTSLDVSSHDGMVDAINAKNLQDSKLLSLVGTILSIENWLVHPVQFTEKETGEVKDGVRTVLITPTGDKLACTSGGVVNSLRALIAVFGPAPWKPPVMVIPREQPTRSGYRTLVLEAVK